jgi:hypothetical protein
MQRRAWIALTVFLFSVVIVVGFGINSVLTRVEASTDAVNETVTRVETTVEQVTDSSTLVKVGRDLGVVAGAAVSAFDSILESR